MNSVNDCFATIMPGNFRASPLLAEMKSFDSLAVVMSTQVPEIKKALYPKRLVLSGSPGKTRTCNLLVNSQPLLPIELPGSTFFLLKNIKTF